jgi:DNA-directed RNA polymerase specialized sigma24 family protein
MLDAKTYLRQVENLDLRIQNKLIERQQWRDIALGITANVGGERVQASGSQQKMANAIEKCVDMEEEINALIDSLIETKKDVIATIEQLESPTEYDILHKRYIQFMPLQEIADRYGREYTTITTAHGRALKNVQNILNKK